MKVRAKLYVRGRDPVRGFKQFVFACGCLVMWPVKSLFMGKRPRCPQHGDWK